MRRTSIRAGKHFASRKWSPGRGCFSPALQLVPTQGTQHWGSRVLPVTRGCQPEMFSSGFENIRSPGRSSHGQVGRDCLSLGALYFILCALFLFENKVQSTKNKAPITKHQVQSSPTQKFAHFPGAAYYSNQPPPSFFAKGVTPCTQTGKQT